MIKFLQGQGRRRFYPQDYREYVRAHCKVPLHLSLTCLRATHRQA